MVSFFQQRRHTSLIVLAAFLLNLFVPALGQVLVSPADRLLMEVCSASARNEQPASGEPARQMPHAMPHCALCCLHGAASAPPPAHIHTFELGGLAVNANLNYQSPTLLLPWSGAKPRGPPALS